MNTILGEIQDDIDWRISEISNLKTIPLRYNMLDEHKHTVALYSVPSFYAIWEGYIKTTFEILTRYLNSLDLPPKAIHLSVLTHAIDKKCNLSNEVKNFSKQSKIVQSLNSFYSRSLHIEQGIPTKSNLNLKVANEILTRFNVEKLDSKYEKPLNRLLMFRNKISHGESSIIVSRNDIDNFSLLVVDLMMDVMLLIEKYINGKRFLIEKT